MAAGVRKSKNFFWTLVNNWKQTEDTELRLNSENGYSVVKYSADLGVWVPPATIPVRSGAGRRSCSYHWRQTQSLLRSNRAGVWWLS